MLRTNINLLSYIGRLYDVENDGESILLKNYHPGEQILVQGNRSNKVLIVKNGITKCYLHEENDKEYILEFLGAGEILGEIEAIQNIQCLCNIKAISQVEAYSISIPFFTGLLEKDLKFNQLLLHTFSDRIINTASRASFQQLHTVEHSLSQLLSLLQKQDLTLGKDDMAAYLGITTRTLNRALKKLNQ